MGSRPDEVFVERVGAAAFRAKASLRDVEVDDDFVARDEVRRVLRAEKVVGGEVARRAFDQLPARKKNPGPAGLFEREPPDIGFVSVFLRHDIRHVLPRDGPAVEADGRAAFAVGIILVRAAPEPAQEIHLRPQRERDAEPRQVGQRLVGEDLVFREDFAVRKNRVNLAVVEAPAFRRGDLVDRDRNRAAGGQFCGDRLGFSRQVVQAGVEPAAERFAVLARPALDAVVVGRRAPDVELRAGREQFLPVPPERFQQAGFLRGGDLECRAPDDDAAVVLFEGEGGSLHGGAAGTAFGGAERHRDLLPCDFVASRAPRGGFRREKSHGEKTFLPGPHGGRRDRQAERLAFARGGFQRGQFPASDGLAIHGELPRSAQPFERREILLVRHNQPAVLSEPDPDRLRELFEFEDSGVRGAVRPDEPVADKIRVVRLVAEVAAIHPERTPLFVGAPDPVIDPFPDESSLEAVVFFKRVVVFAEAAVAVPHRVRILAHDQRAGVFGRLRPADDVGDRRIHRADQVCRGAAVGGIVPPRTVAHRALVVEDARRIVFADPAGHGLVVRPPAALVAERPRDDARMVLVPLDHPQPAFEKRRRVSRLVANRELKRVRLDIRLVDEVEPELVAEVIPERVVRVVRGADRIEVVLLHEPDIADHRLAADDLPGRVVVLVAVDAVDHHRTAVDQQLAPADLDAPETHAAACRLDDFAGGRDQRDDERVKVRGLR